MDTNFLKAHAERCRSLAENGICTVAFNSDGHSTVSNNANLVAC